MPITILSATLVSHTDDHASGEITARVSYVFNNGAVEDKIHSGIPVAAVRGIAQAAGRSDYTPLDITEAVRTGLGAPAADLVFTVATPPAPRENA